MALWVRLSPFHTGAGAKFEPLSLQTKPEITLSWDVASPGAP